VTALVWNYHDDEAIAADTPVEMNVSGLPVGGKVLIRHYRIDQSHSNSYTVWKAMGSPQSPDNEQYQALKAGGHLQLLGSPRWVQCKGEAVKLDFSMPRESVSLVELSW
jgi:xylan 1,4-beta-xylosidase